ncbi:tetratricopeptide repeat protein [Schleiferiaceae bacterium]|nr:tetratricopeptide repeat protein [Schleiferiaceae bacterium]
MGATVISLSDSASTLYADGQFESARTLFESLAVKGTSDPALYYNIGNCCTRLGQFGEARLWFERSLLLDPSNEETLHNLEWLNTRLTDSLPPPNDALLHWIGHQLRAILAPEHWGLFAGVLLVGALSLLLLRKFKRPALSWRLPLTLSSIGLVLLLAAQISIPQSDKVVVVSNNSYGYSAPDANGKRIVLLSEGSAGRLVRASEGWFYIALGDGRQAWFSSDHWCRVIPINPR